MTQTGINLENVKINNKSTILRLLNNQGAMSRKDIAKLVGLTPAAVTLLCTELIEEGILKEKGELVEEKRAGRKKVLVDINYKYKYVLAVSIETEITFITICDMKGRIIGSRQIANGNIAKPEVFLESLAQECKALLWEHNKMQDDLLGVGICIPGIVDRKRGISIRAYGIWKQEVHIRQFMEEKMQCPVIVENNVKAFAEGELLYGLGKTGDDLLFVKWGPGVGSAMVLQNQIYEGKEHRAAELGHYIIEPGGELCRCGRRGCLETRVSVRAVRKAIANIYSEENTPVLYLETGGDINSITEEAVIKWMKECSGEEKQLDQCVADIMEKSIERIARAVVNVITVFAPEHTVVFGSLLEDQAVCRRFLKYCGNMTHLIRRNI